LSSPEKSFQTEANLTMAKTFSAQHNQTKKSHTNRCFLQADKALTKLCSDYDHYPDKFEFLQKIAFVLASK